MLETLWNEVDGNVVDSHRQAVLYTRVSSKDQERGGFSIPAQRRLLQRYARENGLDIVDEFSDVETAGRAGRTEFEAMIRHLKRHRGREVILVEKTDRLYRNLKDWVTLDDLGVEVHLVTEGITLSEASVSSEKFIHGIKVLVAKNFLDNLSEEVRKGQLEKLLQGHWPASAPLGYRNVEGPDGKRIVESDPVRGPIISKVFEWYATGRYSVTEVTKMAKAAGLVTRRSRKPVPRSAIHAILRKPFYVGELTWKGIGYSGVHEPLVLREVWDDVQAILSGRAPRRKTRHCQRFTFSRLLRCGVCTDEGKDFLLVAEQHKGRYVYYRCEECKRQKQVSYIREEKITAAFARALSELEPTEKLLAMMRVVLEGGNGEVDDSRTAVDELQTELSVLEEQLEVAYEDRLAGRIPPSLFDRKALGWHLRTAELRREIEEHQKCSVHSRTDEARALELQHLIDIFQISQDGSRKRRLIETLHSNSSWKDGVLRVEWKTV